MPGYLKKNPETSIQMIFLFGKMNMLTFELPLSVVYVGRSVEGVRLTRDVHLVRIVLPRPQFNQAVLTIEGKVSHVHHANGLHGNWNQPRYLIIIGTLHQDCK